MRLISSRNLAQLSPDDAASEWFIRHDRGELTADEEARFLAWLSASPQNEEAYDRACLAWDAFEGAQSDSDFVALRQEALRAGPVPGRKWWLPAGVAVAASIAAAMVMMPSAPFNPVERPTEIASSTRSTAMPAGRTPLHSYATQKGERRVISLPDGSTITLNTDTVIDLAFGSGKRLVRLTRGQALFEVEKDRSRPFVVEAGGRQITALGTVFEVRLDPGRVKVLLVEGRVIVDKANGAQVAANFKPTILKPGEELLAELGSEQRVATTDVTSELLWRDGYIEFQDEPLGDAVAEINRYSDREIILKDARLANMRLSGVFRTGDPQRFSALVSELLPVTTRPATGGDVEIVASN